MDSYQIEEIGIDEKGSIYLKPSNIEFSYIYREAAEVHWNADKKVLHSPKPREWSYLDWYIHIKKVASLLDCKLYITNNTNFTNVPNGLKKEIIAFESKRHT